MQSAVRDPKELIRILHLPAELLPAARSAAADFPLCVPREFISRMTPGDVNDPLLRQVLPLDAELQETRGYSQDAVGDLDSLKDGGILHKYRGRALLIATGSCAIHCRYCFRRHFPYQEINASQLNWQPAIKQLENDHSIEEVILSGGDPLMLSDRRLGDLITQLKQNPRIKRLRIHSRNPVVLPQRITDNLVAQLADNGLQNVIVIHANHANEINADVALAMQKLAAGNVTLLNQSVLLRGVNDNADALMHLSLRLFECGVLPYYLHQLDKVTGVQHFEVDDQTARSLMRALAARLPGYMVPRLVREEPGMAYKQPLSW